MLSIQCAHTAPHTRSSLRTPGRPAWSPPNPARRPPAPSFRGRPPAAPSPAPPPARPRSPAPASRCGVFLEELPAFLLRMLHFCWPISFLLAVADGAALATKNAPLRSRALTHTPGTAGSGLGGAQCQQGQGAGTLHRRLLPLSCRRPTGRAAPVSCPLVPPRVASIPECTSWPRTAASASAITPVFPPVRRKKREN